MPPPAGFSHGGQRGKGDALEDNAFYFEIPGLPQGKGRPRFQKGKKPYTPQKTRGYEQDVRTHFLLAHFARFQRPMTGESSLFGTQGVEVEITAYLPAPKRTSRAVGRLISLGLIYPLKKPDADNIAKAVLDALNRYAYNDDQQVTDLVVRKRYCPAGEEHVCVKIRPSFGAADEDGNQAS